jgi:hypothetical protein
LTGTPRVDETWVQHLADLLTTERSWREQYTALIALGRRRHVSALAALTDPNVRWRQPNEHGT